MAKISKRFVDALPPDHEAVYWDDNLKGFGLRVKASGLMSYVVQYRNRQGRSCRYTIGQARRRMQSDSSRVWTPDEARTEAQGLLLSVRKGGDPLATKRDVRPDPRVSELVDSYLSEAPADKPGKKASSWATDASNLRRHVVPILGKRHLSTLVKADIQRFQRDVTNGKTKADIRTGKPRGRAIVEGGPGTAARATVVLAAMLKWAVERGLRPDNPAKGVKLNKLQSRERFLSSAELTALGDAVVKAEAEGVNRVALAALRLLVLTGARKSEILSLRWEHVDFERAALRLPDSKTGAKVVPLGAPALEVLAGLTRDDEASPFVFPAGRGKGHLIGLPAVWRRVAKAAKLQGVRIHDLRHGFASVAAADGSSLYIIGKMLGHTQAATTERYSHLDLDPVRAAADRTSRKIAAAMASGATAAGAADAVVVPLAASRRAPA